MLKTPLGTPTADNTFSKAGRLTWAAGVETNVDMTPVIKENFIKLMAGSLTADEFVAAMQEAAK